MKIKLGSLKKVIKEEIQRSNLISKWEESGLLRGLVSEEKKFQAAKFLDKHMKEALVDIKKNRLSGKDARLRTEAVVKAAKPLLK